MKDISTLIKYEFRSHCCEQMDGDRYIREFNASIFAENEKKSEKLIGKVLFKIVYIDEAINAEYDLYEIFDTYEYTFRHAQEFFDFNTDELKENIQKHYSFELYGSNICMLEKIEILPEFRGLKIAAKVIRDIVFHFGSACGLFIIQAFPLQFEPFNSDEDEWRKQLQLNNFPSTKATAFKQLTEYYISIGFEKIVGYKDLLFYNPALKNKKMDAINLEE